MNFFRRNFTIKIFILLLAVGFVFAGVTLLYRYRFGLLFFPFDFVFYGFIGFTLLIIGVFWFSVSLPLREIIHQMEALITGREYKKFFTKRVDEIGVIAHFFNEITRRLHSFSGELQEGQRMRSELEIASSIQKNILPLQVPPSPGLIIAAKTKSAVQVGGDSFDFIPEQNSLYFYIGDATGHGVPAGLVMTMVNTLIRAFVSTSTSLSALLSDVNRVLKTRIDRTLFMSLVMFRWDALGKILTFVGAGHEYILVHRMKTGECDVIPSAGIALGMVPDCSRLLSEHALPFEEGDLLLLYTDGIVECRNGSGEMYGMERLKKAVAQFASQYTPSVTLSKIAADIATFTAGSTQTDDMTLIAVKRVPEGVPSESQLQFSPNWEDAAAS